MTNEYPATLPFYMADVDLVRETDNRVISVTFYDEDWDISDFLTQGYEVVCVTEW